VSSNPKARVCKWTSSVRSTFHTWKVESNSPPIDS